MMSALIAALFAALAATTAHATGACDAAYTSAFYGVFVGDCTPVNGTCPVSCGMLFQSTLAACQGRNFTFGGTRDPHPFEAGVVVAALSLFLRGPCVEAAVNAVFNSTEYSPTCRDGMVLFLTASRYLCGASSSNISMCPAECESVVDVAFDHCESTEALDFNGTELSAAEAVGLVREVGLFSPECSAFLDTRTFIGEASGRPGALPMPMSSTLVTNTECDEAFSSARPVIHGDACVTSSGDTCPMACRDTLESLLATCAGANFTLLPFDHVFPFPLTSAIGIAQGLPGACQEVPIEILLSSAAYEPTCEDALHMFVAATGIPACQEDDAPMCPEICQLLIGAPFDLCHGTDQVHINGTQFVAGDLVAMAGAPLSDMCSEVLGTRVFGMRGVGTTTAEEVEGHSAMKPNPSTTASVMMGSITTIAEDEGAVSSSAIWAALSASVLAAATVALVLNSR